MTGILEKLKWESLKKRRRNSRLILLYKGLNGAASIPTDDLILLIRRSRSHDFRHPLQELIITRAHSSLKQSEIGMSFQIWLLSLLKVWMIVWLGLPLWWELGTNFPYYRSWWINVMGHTKILEHYQNAWEKYKDTCERHLLKTPILALNNKYMYILVHLQPVHTIENMLTVLYTCTMFGFSMCHLYALAVLSNYLSVHTFLQIMDIVVIIQFSTCSIFRNIINIWKS